MTHPIICIVDDDGPLRASLCDLMRSAGYVSYAFASAEALLAAPPLRFDCIVTDIHMPGPSGIDLLQRVRSQQEHACVIIMTADVALGWRAQALACGAAAFLEKPFDGKLLLELVAKSLGSGAARR